MPLPPDNTDTSKYSQQQAPLENDHQHEHLCEEGVKSTPASAIQRQVSTVSVDFGVILWAVANCCRTFMMNIKYLLLSPLN